MKADKSVTEIGFSLIELAVVIAIIGMLTAFALPRLRASIERSRAADAFSYLAEVQAAQTRYYAKHNTYAANIADLDIKMKLPKYFTTPSIFSEGNTDDLAESWTLTLTRRGSAAGYGNYTVTFTQDGYDSGTSDIDDDINPIQS
jgi:type IV pilus assembly protein PilE